MLYWNQLRWRPRARTFRRSFDCCTCWEYSIEDCKKVNWMSEEEEHGGCAITVALSKPAGLPFRYCLMPDQTAISDEVQFFSRSHSPELSIGRMIRSFQRNEAGHVRMEHRHRHDANLLYSIVSVRQYSRSPFMTRASTEKSALEYRYGLS